MTMLPDRGVGVAVFTNRSQGMVPEILANYVFDRVCGKEPISWLDRLRERRRKFVAQLDVDRQARKVTRRPNSRPSHDLADYAGDYDHPGYGRITITHAEGKLNWAYRGMSEPLAHRHYDPFELPEAPGRLLPDGLAGRFRRILPVPARSGGGRLTERTPAVQPRPGEPLLMPLKRPSRSARELAQLGPGPLATTVKLGRASAAPRHIAPLGDSEKRV
jgi:hypothetical protein